MKMLVSVFELGKRSASECAFVPLPTGLAVQKTAKVIGLLRTSWAERLSVWMATREANLLSALKGVPGVPEFIGFAGRDVFLRTYLPGRPASWGWVPSPVQIRALARVVEAIHRRNVSCLDLGNPSNIILLSDGGIGLVDFNTAVKASGPMSRLWYGVGVVEDQYHIEKYRYLGDRCCPVSRPASLGRRIYRFLRHFLLHPLALVGGTRTVRHFAIRGLRR